ncbi:hypothetical protein [Singulisphaera sp. PoT]|uniref:hypothetical protein n=1 Tax=Singulisphaera sp. PoT TaxID=3411797 RepID=UPI003BF58674
MPETLITRFDPDPALLEPLLEAASYQPWDAEKTWSQDWPGNVLSKRIVIYGDGTIARRGEAVRFAVDPGELALCRRMAAEAEAVVHGLMIAGGSGGNEFRPFYNTASQGVTAPARIDGDLIRGRFAGTIFPQAEVAVEPMAEAGEWWAVVEEVFKDDPDLGRWKEAVRWFRSRPEFIDAAYIRIGDNLENASGMPEDPEAEAFGVVMPRLAVGLTHKGSLAGLAGCVILA